MSAVGTCAASTTQLRRKRIVLNPTSYPHTWKCTNGNSCHFHVAARKKVHMEKPLKVSCLLKLTIIMSYIIYKGRIGKLAFYKVTSLKTIKTKQNI